MLTNDETTYLEASTPQEDTFEDSEAFYQEELGAMHIGQQEDFHVTDERSADWVANRIAAWKRELEARKAAFKAEEKKIQRKIEWFESRFALEMENFAMLQLMARNANKKTQTKSLRLPCGMQIGYRLQPDKIKIYDQDLFEAWVVDNKAEFVRDYRPEINEKALLADLMASGGDAVPEGAQLQRAYDKFFMKA